MKRIVLGSSSPRRQEMLRGLGIPFTVRTPNVDEENVLIINPIEKVETLAKLKANNISLQSEDEVIVTADTIVAYQGTIFEKPKDKEEAYQMITTLSGTIHEVITAVALRSTEKEEVFSVTTKVKFWDLTEEEIKAYIKTEEPYDKAGAYGIQDRAGTFVKKINGDYYNVVGLPVASLLRKLRKFDFNANKYIFSTEQDEL